MPHAGSPTDTPIRDVVDVDESSAGGPTSPANASIAEPLSPATSGPIENINLAAAAEEEQTAGASPSNGPSEGRSNNCVDRAAAPYINIMTPSPSQKGGGGGCDKSEAPHLASDVYSILTVRGSGYDEGGGCGLIEGGGNDMAASALPGDPTVVENAILEKVAAIPRGRTRAGAAAAGAGGAGNVVLPSRSCQVAGNSRSFRHFFFRRASSGGGGIPAPPKGVICAFCSEMLHFPAYLPCAHMADLECLIANVPLSECPSCHTPLQGNKSLAELAVPEHLMRKMERDRLAYLNRIRGRERRIFSRTDPLQRSQRFPAFTRCARNPEPPDQDIMAYADQPSPASARRLRHRLFRIFRRRHDSEAPPLQ